MKDDWEFAWIDSCGRDGELLEIEAVKGAPVYHSRARPGTPFAERFEYIDNFWLPLVSLADRHKVKQLLVHPIKRIAEGDLSALAGQNEPYLYVK